MYAQIVKFVLGLDTEWEADRMADITYRKLKSQKGFVRFDCLQDYLNGEYKWIAYWDTEEDLNRSVDEVYPWFKQLIGDRFQWEPSVQVFRVYNPAAHERRSGTDNLFQ